VNTPGWTVRAVSPSGLHADPLLVPEASGVALTAFYGSPLTYLGYVSLEALPFVSDTIAVGVGPIGVAFRPDGATAYIANAGADTVNVIDVASGTVTATIPVGYHPIGVAFAPDGATAYVANFNSDTVSVIDVASGTVTNTIPVGDGPHSVAFTPDGNTAYVTSVNGNTVSVIDVASGTVTATIPVGTIPADVAFTPDGNTAYVTNANDDTVSVIDVASGTVTATIPVGDWAHFVAFTPDGNTAYVTNANSATVSVIDVASGTVTATIPVGDWPTGVAFMPDGNTAYIANHQSDTMSVIDVASGTVTATIPVGDAPHYVAFRPGKNMAYVTNTSGNTVSVIHRYDKRVFIGPKGQDQGFDPPFGYSGAGAIVSERTDCVVSCVLLEAKTRNTLAVTWTPGGPDGFLAIAAVTADQITKVWADQGMGKAPKRLVGGVGAYFPATINTQVLLKFESGTGKLLTVMPTRAQATRGSGPGYEVRDHGDGTVTLQGEFVGVYDVTLDRDVAPGGASAVTLDAATGKVLGVD
jgi:YVTN family beta-propeller protein